MYQERRSDQSVEPRPNLYFTVKSQRHTTDLYHYSLLTGPTGLGTGSGLLMGATTWFIVSAGRILGKATANTHRSCCRSHLPFLLNQGRFGGSQSSAWSNPALPAPPPPRPRNASIFFLLLSVWTSWEVLQILLLQWNPAAGVTRLLDPPCN